MSSLKLDSREIQQAAVMLNRKITDADPSANDYISNLITNFLNLLNSFGFLKQLHQVQDSSLLHL